jgi:hypothetical protein
VEQETQKQGTSIESFKADLGKMADARELMDYAGARNN